MLFFFLREETYRLKFFKIDTGGHDIVKDSVFCTISNSINLIQVQFDSIICGIVIKDKYLIHLQ